MLFDNITIIDENLEIKENMYVGVKGDTIAYVGSEAPKEDFGEKVPGKGKLLMSGFVNNHAHSPMTLLRGYAENLPLDKWLNEKVFPFEDKLSSEAVYYGTLLAMAESARFGIVSSSDMYYFTEDMVNAVAKSGEKANISRSITAFGETDIWKLTGAAEMKDAFERFDGMCDGRIKIDMSLHAEYTNNLEAIKQIAAYTKKVGANMHVHVSETKSEHEACKEKYGMTPMALFAENGMLDTPTIAAHCVWVEGNDYAIMREKGVSVAVNPMSNLKLASGVCNVQKLLDEGINVTIGTDSVSSNNSLSFIEEMKAFAVAPKMMYKDAAAITPTETIRAATVNGAKAQGRMDCGILKEGAKADLVMIDIAVPWMQPMHDLKNNLVYSAQGTDVVMTMVDGKVLYENGEYKTIDIEETIYNVNRVTKEILAKL